MTDSFTPMTPAARQAELRAIVDAMPGKNATARIAAAAALLLLRPATVRGWLLRSPHRHVPARQLALLRAAVAAR